MRRAGAAALVALAAGSLAIAFARERTVRAEPEPVAFASGALSSNSRDGQAILSSPGLGPGDSASGDVTVANDGAGAGELTLVQRLRSQAQGAGGALLYDRLVLEVRRVSGTGAPGPELLFSGPLNALGSTPVGRFDPGESHTYRFAVTFPHGSDDDSFQGASVSVDYEWTARGASPGAPAGADRPRVEVAPVCRFGMLGTPGPDRLVGTRRDDRIRARGGDDVVLGLRGPDCIWAGRGDDRVGGGKGPDRIRGGYGDDALRGGRGDDAIRGRQGDDLVVGGPGHDRLRGTSGDDLIVANDGHRDHIRCGIGFDTAVVDSHDRHRGCERELQGPAPGSRAAIDAIPALDP